MPGNCANSFLLINGITGGSTAPGHSGWIDVSSMIHGAARAVSLSGGTGISVSNPSYSEMNLTLSLDQSSPPLFNLIGRGAQPSAQLEFARSSPSAIQFYHLTLNRVFISGISMGVSIGGKPTISLSLFYEQIS